MVLGDLSSAYAGSGTYRLTVNGLTDGLKFRIQRAAARIPQVIAIGGVPGTSLVLLTTTNVATPMALWTPILTNSFEPFGVFTYTNTYKPVLAQQYFRYLLP